MKTTIDLLRHGEAVGGSYYRGSTDDPLSDHGWLQMQQQTSDGDWDVIISSPLRRCRRFAQQLSKQRKIPLLIIEDFREIHFGDWEGQTAEQIQQTTPNWLMRFYNNPVTCTPPHGESYHAFSWRVNHGWTQLLAAHQGKTVLLITHAGVMRELFSRLLGMPVGNSFRIDIPPACLSRFQCFHADDGDFVQLLAHTPLSTA